MSSEASAGSPYHDGQRSFQDRFDTRRLADRLAESTTPVISPRHRAFIERRDMFFLATADADGWPQCSYKGGDPGFVRVLDETTLAFPSYDGNGMFLSAGNVLVNPRVGLLFIDFDIGTRLRMNGVASIDGDDPLVASYPGAKLVVRVAAREVSPTAGATFTATASCSARRSCRRPRPSRRCRTGSSTSGSTARCRRVAPRSTPTGRAPPRSLSSSEAEAWYGGGSSQSA